MTIEELNEKLGEVADKYVNARIDARKELGYEGYWKKYDEFMAAEEAENEVLIREFWDGVKVGDGVTLDLYSDSEAFTIIKKTPCTITVQRDKATLKPGWKPEFVPGGFCGYCINQSEQEYDYERNPKGQIVTLRWSKKNHSYVNKGWRGCSYGRHEFYDYNF